MRGTGGKRRGDGKVQRAPTTRLKKTGSSPVRNGGLQRVEGRRVFYSKTRVDPFYKEDGKQGRLGRRDGGSEGRCGETTEEGCMEDTSPGRS